jgi:hypothetical protein
VGNITGSLFALMMEATRTSETLVNFYQTTQRYSPEDSHLRTDRCENLKSYTLGDFSGSREAVRNFFYNEINGNLISDLRIFTLQTVLIERFTFVNRGTGVCYTNVCHCNERFRNVILKLGFENMPAFCERHLSAHNASGEHIWNLTKAILSPFLAVCEFFFFCLYQEDAGNAGKRSEWILFPPPLPSSRSRTCLELLIFTPLFHLSLIVKLPRNGLW